MKNYWFEVITEGSDLEGEEFFVQAETLAEAKQIAADNFEGEELKYHGKVSDWYAEMAGLDTY